MSKLRETNLQKMKDHAKLSNVEFATNFQKKYGKDLYDAEAFPIFKEGFSMKKLKQQIALKEADSESGFVQNLRAGIIQAVNAGYDQSETTFEDWVTVIPSKKKTELYAPTHGPGFLRQIGEDTNYPYVGSASLDIKLQNIKWGAGYAVTRELYEDDQTGLIAEQPKLLGEYCRLIAEVVCYGKLASVAGGVDYAQVHIPVSETQPSTEPIYPWVSKAAGGFVNGGGYTRFNAYQALSQASLQNAFIALAEQKNLQGLLMVSRPNRLLISSKNQFDAAVLLNSSMYPTGATPGATGGAFAINPLKSICDVTVTQFMFDQPTAQVNANSTAWYLVNDKKAWFVLQMREAASVEQEATNSGESFEKDQYRFKVRTRLNADFIDPRYAFQGNDGSV